jgi:hypothetical protein
MLSTSLRVFAQLTAMTLVTAACASQAASTSAGGTPPGPASASPPAAGPSAAPTATGASASPPAASVSASAPSGGSCGGGAKPAPSGTLTLGNRDSGSTFCLRVGQQVMVYLQGSPSRMWAPIRSDSSALRPAPSGRLMLVRGVTGAAFTAARPGIAHITSARPACVGTPVRCDALMAFQVTVDIPAPAG